MEIWKGKGWIRQWTPLWNRLNSMEICHSALVNGLIFTLWNRLNSMEIHVHRKGNENQRRCFEID